MRSSCLSLLSAGISQMHYYTPDLRPAVSVPSRKLQGSEDRPQLESQRNNDQSNWDTVLTMFRAPSPIFSISLLKTVRGGCQLKKESSEEQTGERKNQGSVWRANCKLECHTKMTTGHLHLGSSLSVTYQGTLNSLLSSNVN